MSLVSIKVLIFHATNLKNRFSKNNHIFHAAGYRNRQNFRTNKEHWIKKHIISERSEDGLSSYVFISISKFFAKIDFFRGGGLN